MATESDKFISAWLNSFASQCTVRSYRADMKQFLAWFKKGDIATAEERDIRNILLDLQERGLAKRTRNRRLASIARHANGGQYSQCP